VKFRDDRQSNKNPKDNGVSDKTPAHVRITFKLQPDEDGYPPSDYERLWAVPLSNGRYQIDNIPFFRSVAGGWRCSYSYSGGGW